MQQDLYGSFEAFVKTHQMLNQDDDVVTGVSGGADSVCLLHLLCRLRKTIPFKITVVHINHMIRGEEADADEEFVRRLCSELKVPFICKKINVPELAGKTGQSEEETGRQVRYRTFFEIAGGKSGKIAVAHHRDDNAETVLQNLVRGTGIKGLTGMQPVSEREGCLILRPLLNQSRESIESYLAGCGLTYRTDITNLDTGYARNLLRLKVLPELTAINDRAAQHICETAAMLGEIEDFLQKETDRLRKTMVVFENDKWMIDIEALKKTDPAIAGRIVLQTMILAAGSAKDICQQHVRQVMNLSDTQSGKQVSLPYSLLAVRRYGWIVIEKNDPAENDLIQKQKDTEIQKAAIGEDWTVLDLTDGRKMMMRTVFVNEHNRDLLLEKNQYTKAFDYDKIKFAITVGARASGDEIFLKNGRKTLKKFFIDEKIPSDQRELIPVVKDAESVMWVTGLRISEKHKLTDNTKKALIITIIGGKDEHKY